MGHTAYSPAKVDSLFKQQAAVELRRQRMSYRRIAAQLGLSTGHAHRLVKAAVTKLNAQLSESTEAMRRLEAEALDAMQAAIAPAAEAGDGKQIDRLLRIQERRAKLLGLDVPVKHEVSETQRLEINGTVSVTHDHRVFAEIIEYRAALLAFPGAGGGDGDVCGDGAPKLVDQVSADAETSRVPDAAAS